MITEASRECLHSCDSFSESFSCTTGPHACTQPKLACLLKCGEEWCHQAYNSAQTCGLKCNKRKCEQVCNVGECSLQCNGVSCKQTCNGSGCSLLCHGKDCKQNCINGECILDCYAGSCEQTCNRSCVMNCRGDRCNHTCNELHKSASFQLQCNNVSKCKQHCQYKESQGNKNFIFPNKAPTSASRPCQLSTGE